jgi:hypothetical protein
MSDSNGDPPKFPLRFQTIALEGPWDEFDPLILVHLGNKFGEIIDSPRPHADSRGYIYGLVRDLVSEKECGETMWTAILFKPSAIDHEVLPPAYWEQDPLMMVPLSHIVAVFCGVDDGSEEGDE